ncbi:eukaryotic translation initiation factor eIF2A, putative, partial [Plasmodium ovale curtisi]
LKFLNRNSARLSIADANSDFFPVVNDFRMVTPEVEKREYPSWSVEIRKDSKMSQESEGNNNLFFLAFSKSKVTIYEYDVNLSKNIVDDIDKEIKKSEHPRHDSGEEEIVKSNQNGEKEKKKKDKLTENSSSNQLKKSVTKFNSDFVINRGIRVYKEYNNVELAACTNDHKKIILVRKENPNVAEVIDLKTDKHLTYIKTETQIKRVSTSPRDTFIVLHCQYKPDIVPTNLYVYRICGKTSKKKKKKIQIDQLEQSSSNTKDEIAYNESLLCEMTLRSYSNNNWPFFKWSENESLCICLVNSQINIYKDNNFKEPSEKLKLDNAEYFDISPEHGNKKEIFLASYEQGSKGKPSIFKIFNMNNLNKYIYSKNFFNSDEIKLKWNKNGTALLLQIHTQIDKEKQSYYGSSNLYFIDTLTCKDVNIMTNKGLIYDTIWSYNQNKFYVCKGEIPAEIVLYDKNGNISYSYGRHKYNTLKLNCNEKLLLTGGFGNLSGDISIWNTSNKKEVTKTKSSCAVICEFFNDGKHFLTATTHPRLRVDNNIKIYKYNGLIVSKINFDELYNAIILPFHKIKFEENDSPNGNNIDTIQLQTYINKQLGIDSKKTGIYRAPGSTALQSWITSSTAKLEKKKSNMPPGCNFVVEEKTHKKKKKKKGTASEEKRE